MSDPKWHEGRLVAFDVESTGVDVFGDRIITAAVVHHTPGRRPRTLTWLIDPGTDIPDEAAAVHGWTRDKIRHHIGDHGMARYTHPGRSAIHADTAQAIFEIAGQVALAMSTGAPLIAFNAAFDLTLLEAECHRHGVDPLTTRLPKGLRGVVDPFVIDKHYSRRKGPRRLSNQCEHYGVLLGGAHDAGADALASLRLVPRQVEAYPELARMTLGQLYQRQIGWRAEQQDSLRDYFDRKGIAHDGCDPSWPLRPFPPGREEAIA